MKQASDDAVFGPVASSRSALEDREITLTADEADQLMVILDDVVSSLDRIGSREASGEDPEHAWVHEYFTAAGATVRLAHARRLVMEAFARVYTDDEQVTLWDERQWPTWAEHLPEIASKPEDR